MMKNVIAEMEMDLILNGVVLKACDFEEDGGEASVTRDSYIPRAEKIRREALHRVNTTGKKHDRSRDDYKEAKNTMERQRGEKKANRGSDYNGYHKARIDALREADEMRNAVADDAYLREETERHERIRKEIISRTEKRAKDLREEAVKMVQLAMNLLNDATGNLKEATRIEMSLKESD